MKTMMILTISFAMLASPAMARGGHGGHGHGHAHVSEHVESGKSSGSRGGMFSYSWWHGSSSSSAAASAAASKSSHSIQCPDGEYRVNGSCTKDKPKSSWW